MTQQKNKMIDKIVDFYQQIENQIERQSHIYGIPTGFKDFDFFTGGLHKSQLTIIGGQTSIGKTAFAINIMNNIFLDSKLPILFISYEMNSYTLLTRIIAAATEISIFLLFRACLSAKNWEKLGNILLQLSKSAENDIFNIKGGYTLGFKELSTEIKNFAEKHPDGVVFIDYFQLIKLEKEENRYEQMAMNAAALKRLAVELNIPIFCYLKLIRNLRRERTNVHC